MTAYRYEAKDSSGHVNVGVIKAPSVIDATAQIRAGGAALLAIAPANAVEAVLEKLRSVSFEMGPGLKDVLGFTTELGVMIKAGISIREAIEGIANQVESPPFRKVIREIQSDVESGQPFSDALAKHPKVFSPLYINMVRASELSGSFGMMLDRIAQYLTQQMETRSMVRGAMVYPGIIATMAISTTVFLLTWVLPRFTALFAGKESLLPLPTTILVGISDFLIQRWYVVIAVLGVLVGGFLWTIHTPRGRIGWDAVKLKLPLFKRMFRALYITRGLQTMGELISAGVPMLQTLAITAEVSGNALYHRMWQTVQTAVKQGDKVARPLAKQRLMPGNVVQMIAAGEESGKLGEVMRDVADYYAKELKATIKTVTAMIEPLMIVLMGVIVGFIAMSIILPMFKMSSLVK